MFFHVILFWYFGHKKCTSFESILFLKIAWKILLKKHLQDFFFQSLHVFRIHIISLDVLNSFLFINCQTTKFNGFVYYFHFYIYLHFFSIASNRYYNFTPCSRILHFYHIDISLVYRKILILPIFVSLIRRILYSFIHNIIISFCVLWSYLTFFFYRCFLILNGFINIYFSNVFIYTYWYLQCWYLMVVKKSIKTQQSFIHKTLTYTSRLKK